MEKQYIKNGDLVGVVAPSRFISGNTKIIKHGITRLVRQGLKVQVGSTFKKKYYFAAGTKYERVKDLNEMFENKNIKAIFCAIGGDTANQVLDLLDYEMIKKNPKPIIGYSDITHLILAIYRKTGLTTYHGPNLNLLSSVTKTSVTQMVDNLMGKNSGINYFSGCKVIKSGHEKGKLIGGNLFVINELSKTDFSPDYRDSILFWEEINEGLHSLEYQLYQLSLSGVLEGIKGMVIGHICETGQEHGRSYKEIILEITKKYNFPILKTSYFGHRVKKFITFPIGVEATINTDKKYFGWV